MLFGFIVDSGLKWVRSKGTEISPTLDQNLVLTMMRILRNLLKDFEDEKYYHSFTDHKMKLVTIDNKFMFSFIWGIGGSLTTECRKTFDVFIKKLVSGEVPLSSDQTPRKKIALPERSNLFEYCLFNKVNLLYF